MKKFLPYFLILLLPFSFFVYKSIAQSDNQLSDQEINARLQELYRKYNIKFKPTFASKIEKEKDKLTKSKKIKYSYLKANLLSKKKELAQIPGKYSLIVLKDEFLMLLYKGKTFIKAYRIGIGMNEDGGQKQAPNDNRTPEGHFSIVKKHNSTYWEFEGKRAYGPWFLRLKTPPWKGIGIHGTDTLDALGRKSTHGCIRTDNNSITELKELLPIGTEVHIYRNAQAFDLEGMNLPDVEEILKELEKNE